ncbi:MAG TPA: methyltransferase domain-containing protein [Verrucomicrobiae bacterium]
MKAEIEKNSFELRGPLGDPVPVMYPNPGRRSRAGFGTERTAPSPFLPYWRFLVAAFTRYTQTGGVVPSQRFLVDRMISAVPRGYRGRIIELGPGTGALTFRLAARCRRADIVACEINPEFADIVHGRVVLEGLERRIKVVSEPAERLLSALARGRFGHRPEFIISGIPLGNLARDSAIALIELIHKALVPGGLYIQFQYSLLDRKKIKDRFSRMRTVPALLNFPPAVVYYAWK